MPRKFRDFPEFRSNLSPAQMFKMGSFGGTYWRPITSAITGKSYKNKHKKYGWSRKIPDRLLTQTEYDKSLNKYGVKVGTSLDYWEKNGWITRYDPYGWVQWYANFYEGRRTPDDRRQIDRWLRIAGPNGRFRRRLINMIRQKYGKNAAKNVDNPAISPKIRQTLQHWAYKLTKKDLIRR